MTIAIQIVDNCVSTAQRAIFWEAVYILQDQSFNQILICLWFILADGQLCKEHQAPGDHSARHQGGNVCRQGMLSTSSLFSQVCFLAPLPPKEVR